MTAALTQRSCRLAAAAMALVKLWLVAAQPIQAVGPSPHDDRLFLRLANLILDGRWLGDYTPVTLAKGPAYPLFIAGTVVTGIPLPVAQHLLYLFACWLAVRAVRPLLRSDTWAFVLLALLWWQPVSYDLSTFGRVLRQQIYVPLALLVFAGLAAWYTRAAERTRLRVGWAVLLGFAWGALWLTREETIWIVPATFLLAGAAILLVRRSGASWWRATQPLVIATLVALTPITIVCALNARHYGWWGTVEFRAPEFIAAYGALNRVQVGGEIPRVPLTRAARLAIYEVSPAFAELRPFVEGEVGRSGARISESVTGLPADDLEIAGGWWMWVLREAVAQAGHASSAREALAFYQRLADEVNAACERGDLPAGPPRATLFPPWQEGYAAHVAEDLPGYLGAFVAFSGFDARPPPSVGDAESLRVFRDLTQWFLAPAPDAPEFDTTTATTARSYRIAVLHGIGWVMRWLCAAAILAGFLAWFVGAGWAGRHGRWPGYRWWFAAAGWGSALAIVLIALLVHVTSFPLFGPIAFAAGYPLALLAAVLAGAELRAGTGGPMNTEL